MRIGRLVVVALGAAACLVLPMDASARPPDEVAATAHDHGRDAGNSDLSDEEVGARSGRGNLDDVDTSTSTTTHPGRRRW